MVNCKNGINYCLIDETNINNLINEIETPSFGFGKKLIIIKKAGLFKKASKTKKKNADKKDVNINDINNNEFKNEETTNNEVVPANIVSKNLAEYIEKNINIINENAILIIIEENVEKTVLLDVLNKNKAFICEFQKLKLNEIIVRLKKICKLYNVKVEDKTLKYLVEKSGFLMQNLINEIRKLLEYVGNNGEITIEDVDKLATNEIDNIIFNLTDGIGTKNVKMAIETLRDLIYLKEPLQSIIVNLYRHYKKLYLVKLAEQEKKDVLEVLELNEKQQFLISKYRHQASYFKTEEIECFLKRMMKLDENSKSGNIDLQVGLESLLCSFS